MQGWKEGPAPKMAQTAASYLQAHARLSSWNDELEFLGFILAELTDPRGLEENGFPWHQAADLPALVDILDHSCAQPDGILKKRLYKKERKRLRNLLTDSKQIRNAVAHHHSLSNAELGTLKTVRDELAKLLEIAIRTVATFRGIREIGWCPYPSVLNTWNENLSYTTEAILLGCGNPPLLSQRERILESLYHPPSQAQSKKKHRAATKDREEHSVMLIGALNRKMKRRREIKEKEKEARLRKLHRLDQHYRQMRQLRLTQLHRLRNFMKYEEREWRVQRSALLEDASIPFPAVDNAVFVIVVLSSPLWLLCSMIRTVYKRWSMRSL